MSHNNSDQTPLSQPLKVETDNNSVHAETSNYYEEDKDNFSRTNDNEDTDSLGPLPPKWEKAYTESGEVYFIE
jgi:atrophin-1 interacting protein 3 (BAI1-associated protein 1)